MQNTLSDPAFSGSATPNLEGAPCSQAHAQRSRSAPAQKPEPAGKEGSPLKP